MNIKVFMLVAIIAAFVLLYLAVVTEILASINKISREINILSNTISLVYKYLDNREDIIYCGECKYRSHEDGEWHSCLLHGGIKMHEDHFCSDGERNNYGKTD